MAKLTENKFILTIIIIAIIIFLHYVKILSPLENLISFAFSPFQNIVYSTGDTISLQISRITHRQNLEQENQDLKHKIDSLEQQIMELKMFIEESNLVDRQNEYLQAQGFNFIHAKIISHSAESNENLFILNKGARDGVQNNMAVVVEEGIMVGKIIQTEDHQSWVLLLIDNQCQVSASLAGQSSITGLAQGEHNISIKIDDVLKTSPLSTGDLVITSGADNNIPVGLVIGEVGEIIDDQTNLFKSAHINSSINFKNLRIVSIVLN